MAGTRIQVRTYGANLVRRHIEGVARNAENIRPCGPAVRKQAAAGYGRSFDRQGPGWAALKPSTQRRRIADGYPPGPILRASGSYRNAATNPFGLIVDAHNDGFDISVNHKVTGYHQGGTKNMKARPLKMSFGDRMALIKIISNHIISGYGDGSGSISY